MPLYEYKCEKCGDVFEVRQKFAEEPLRIHEKCGGLVNRVLSAPALQFKGSGWYVNDYAKSTKSEDTGSAKRESADKKDSGDKKSGTAKKDSGTPSTATTGESSKSSSETKSS